MTIKQAVLGMLRAALGSKGYELVPRWELASVPLVNHLKRIFTIYEVDCVIDVGGNLGQFASLLRTRVGFSGTIITFEPVSKYIRILEEISQEDGKWRIVGCALGSKAGFAEINVTRSPGLNSFLHPNYDQVKGYWQDGEQVGSETVEVSTLDTALAALGHDCLKMSTYLKLDTQGFDLEVLSGAAQSLPGIRGLQTEASVRAIYDGMPNYQATLSAIAGAGFNLSGMFPVTLDRAGRLIEFDCVAVNSRFAEGI